MMRVLLLYCSTGEGHDSAAKAIIDALALQDVSAERQDALALLSPRLAKFIGNWHVRLYRYAPKLFDVGYRMVDRATDDPDSGDFLYETLALGSRKLHHFLRDGQYDAVICTHVFAGMLMTEVRRSFRESLPCFLVATDYSCAPYTEQCALDGYFLPSASLIAEFAAAGLPRSLLFPTGIPIRQAFYTHQSQSTVRCALGLPQDGAIVLMMGGSMGCGPLGKIGRGLRERLSDKVSVVAVCGRNERLYTALSPLECSHFRVLGFTQEIPAYMDAADLIITKPGGLSSTEAAVKHLPMVLINTVGGCETDNFQLFLKRGYAVGSKNADSILELVDELLASPEQRNQMRQALTRDFTENSANRIAALTISAIHSRQQQSHPADL